MRRASLRPAPDRLLAHRAPQEALVLEDLPAAALAPAGAAAPVYRPVAAAAVCRREAAAVCLEAEDDIMSSNSNVAPFSGLESKWRRCRRAFRAGLGSNRVAHLACAEPLIFGHR